MHDESQLLAGVFHYPRLILARGEGCHVWDVAGRRYLDFTAGLGVAALGHGRADLALALMEQYATLGHCSNLYGNLPALELAQRLKESSFAARVWFANSGAEGNEAALKFARLHGRHAGGARKHVIVAFKGGFHGRTLGALAATHHPEYRAPFAPLVPGVRFARFDDLAAAERAMDERVCAVIVEPVQGEGGVVPARPEFLRGLRELCDRHDALLVFDEVQCGLGRIGELYAYQAYGVVPDLLVLAKPLAAGLPLGAVLIAERVASLLRPGQHGSTFSGGPAACALGVRVFDAVSRPEFLSRVRALGERLRAGLDALAASSTLFRAARGRGLMQALVVAQPRRHPPGEIVTRAREHGLLVTRAGDDAVRLLPPLVCSEDEVDEALAVLGAVAAERSPRRRAVRHEPAELALPVGAGGGR
jgi:predicted acetylornithine/succinylornithine family transaminase